MKLLKQIFVDHRAWWVWTLRLLLGAVFVLSGFAKADDLWGSIFKFEEYFAAWGWAIPRTATLILAMVLSGMEFVFGALLVLGCYRRVAPGVLMLITIIMLPLTLWIWVRDPVADCGCFGDMWVISNAATFWKNVVLVAGFAALLTSNRRVGGMFTRWSQWAVGALLTLYVIALGIIGYNYQPPVDFRRFPVGTSLLQVDDDMDLAAVSYAFVYEKDGERRSFAMAELPDSTWTFVDRVLLSGDEDVPADGLAIFDADGDNITVDAIESDGEQMLIVIPDLRRINPGQTYLINELNRYMDERGGALVTLISPDRGGLDFYLDISMADYPVYTVEPSQLKELVRGNIGVVLLRDGVVEWKRTLNSLELTDFTGLDHAESLEDYDFSGTAVMGWISGVIGLLLLALWLVDRAGYTIYTFHHRRKRRRESTAAVNEPVQSANRPQDPEPMP